LKVKRREKPNSSRVGTSGSEGTRRSPLLPSGRTRPAFIISPAEAMLWKPPWICPASMSWSMGVSPR
jgi:hypothetical protein